MFGCGIIWTQKRSSVLLSGFFFNLYSYNRKNTVTQTKIATCFCWDLIISVQEYYYNLLSLALISLFGNWNTCLSFFKRRKSCEISYNIYFKTMLLLLDSTFYRSTTP